MVGWGGRMGLNFYKNSAPLRRRKCGDTSVSPAPPRRTYFLVASNPPSNSTKKILRKGGFSLLAGVSL